MGGLKFSRLFFIIPSIGVADWKYLSIIFIIYLYFSLISRERVYFIFGKAHFIPDNTISQKWDMSKVILISSVVLIFDDSTTKCLHTRKLYHPPLPFCVSKHGRAFCTPFYIISSLASYPSYNQEVAAANQSLAVFFQKKKAKEQTLSPMAVYSFLGVSY